jgi:hypothetical protein
MQVAAGAIRSNHDRLAIVDAGLLEATLAIVDAGTVLSLASLV